MNLWDWDENTLFTTFIVGARYITVLHCCVTCEEVIEQVLELAGKDKTPFVILSSIMCNGRYNVFLDNELAELVIGL